MPMTHGGLARVSLGSAKEIGPRLTAKGRFENRSQASRAGARRPAEVARGIERLATLAAAQGAPQIRFGNDAS